MIFTVFTNRQHHFSLIGPPFLCMRSFETPLLTYLSFPLDLCLCRIETFVPSLYRRGSKLITNSYYSSNSLHRYVHLREKDLSESSLDVLRIHFLPLNQTPRNKADRQNNCCSNKHIVECLERGERGSY